MKLALMALLPVLLTCNSCLSTGNSSLNYSGLHSPVQIHLLKGRQYQFQEGNLTGNGEAYHSDWAYRMAVLTGQQQ